MKGYHRLNASAREPLPPPDGFSGPTTEEKSDKDFLETTEGEGAPLRLKAIGLSSPNAEDTDPDLSSVTEGRPP